MTVSNFGCRHRFGLGLKSGVAPLRPNPAIIQAWSTWQRSCGTSMFVSELSSGDTAHSQMRAGITF